MHKKKSNINLVNIGEAILRELLVVFHTIKWKHLHIAAVLCQSF